MNNFMVPCITENLSQSSHVKKANATVTRGEAVVRYCSMNKIIACNLVAFEMGALKERCSSVPSSKRLWRITTAIKQQ